MASASQESQPAGKSPELKSKVVATEAVGIYSKSKLTSVPLHVAGKRVAVTVRVCAKEKFARNKKINITLFDFNKIYI